MVILIDLSTLSEKNRAVYEQLDAHSDRLGPPWLEHNKRIGYLRRCQAFKENTARHRKRKPGVPLAYHGINRELHPTKTDGLGLRIPEALACLVDLLHLVPSYMS